LDEVSNDKNGNVPNESLLQDAEKSGFERHNANFSPDPLLNASHGDSQQKYKSIYPKILFLQDDLSYIPHCQREMKEPKLQH